MAGIYIHIPFCKHACHYCNFHFSTTQRLKPQLVGAICREAVLRKTYLQQDVSTVYFGGGTPSVCTIAELQQLIQTLRENFVVLPDAEITLEANPDDITPEQLQAWKQLGINRLSIGVQSFNNEDLQWMNRAHNAQQALQSIEWATLFFDNITIDLIYGSPALTNDQWLQNIHTAIHLGVTHLSCYALTVEPRTALHKLIEQKQLPDVDADKQARHFEILVNTATAAGFEHYEISNLAKPGYRSKHNSSYWQGKNYIGLGPSAHSFNGSSRQWNMANNALYIQQISQGIIPCEVEQLSTANQLNEYIMTSLRTIEGLSLQRVQQQFGQPAAQRLLQTVAKWQQSQHAVVGDDHIRLTKQGRFLADGIAASLFE